MAATTLRLGFLLILTSFRAAASEDAAKTAVEPLDAKTRAAEPAHGDQSAPRSPVYIPPSRGQAQARVGAATRGDRDDVARLQAYAPDHVGLTVTPQPTLYWTLSRRSDVPIDVTLIDDRSAEPVFEYTLDPPVTAGFHPIDLREHGVSLTPGTEYQWYVAMVSNPERRSHNVVSGGAIQLTANTFSESGSESTTPQDAFFYAENGIWYDSVMNLRDQIEAAPDNQALRLMLDSLAQQVGLSPEIR